MKLSNIKGLLFLSMLVFSWLVCSGAGGRAVGQGEQAEKQVKFNPSGSEFSVLFPGQPVVKTMKMKEENGSRNRVVRAELQLEHDPYFIRAEFTPRLSYSMEILGDEALKETAHRYAALEGLQNIQVSVETGKLGKQVTTRGFKNVGGIQCTFEVVTYYGRVSILVLYAGGPSIGYPPQQVERFFGSVSK
ncbi:MAG TPA: hypothetical protein VNH22_13905 [Blastocatellia bacterium]|jgi:hypothetical protein|nr:hypothetical protein [Blastocatellia bacterium]